MCKKRKTAEPAVAEAKPEAKKAKAAAKDVVKAGEPKADAKPVSASPAEKPHTQAAKSKAAKDNEIDDIFGNAKQAAKELATAAPAEDVAKEKGGKGKKAVKVEGSKDDLFGSEAAAKRKRTEEGFAIYTEDELGLGKKGGDTDLCPFDCECCF